MGSVVDHIELFSKQHPGGECTLHSYDFIGCLEIVNGKMNGLLAAWNTTILLYICITVVVYCRILQRQRLNCWHNSLIILVTR